MTSVREVVEPPLRVLLFVLVWLLLAAIVRADEPGLDVQPAEVVLRGNFAQAQLLISARTGSEGDALRRDDLTHAATYVSLNPAVVQVSETGRLLALADGTAEIQISHGTSTSRVPVTVSGVSPEPRIDYLEQVGPILTKAGCTMGGCHASQHGQAGFKLSVFGFAPELDQAAIVRDRNQRRINFVEPEKSLFLLKPTLTIPHGGSKRISAGSVDYQTLVAWIRSGALGPQPTARHVTGLRVTPNERIGHTGMTQQLRAEATYNDGSTRDVTTWAKFDSLDDAVVGVSKDGLVTAGGHGQAAIMVRFEGQAQIANFIVPIQEGIELADWQNNNFVDELASRKFRELGITPSAVCDDATFLRRAYLDAIGTLPTAEEASAFLASTDPNKRSQLVDRLLGLTGDPQLDIYNEAYSAYWTLKWSDLIRNESNAIGEQGMWALHNWIRDAFRANKPFDEFVRELVTAQGSIFRNGPANYFRINGSPPDLAESTAQLFMGVRLQCAKCHHHPFEKYSQEDYYSFAAFFARVTSKSSSEFGLFGGESVVMVTSSGEVGHPKTGAVLPPKPLEGTAGEHPIDRRLPLAQWLTSKENTDFGKSVVNRYMGYLLGRGLVEPIDDMRATNPPTNVALMEALSQDFVDSGYNLKQLMRSIMHSRLYQLDSQPTEANRADEKFYSHFEVKRIPAEALLDAIDRVTGMPTKFKSLPLGTRAIELPDAEYPDYFLKTFGKPRRASVCECERVPDENLAQALHTLNGDVLAGKIAHAEGRVAKLAASGKPHDEIVDELYLVCLSRRPTDAERAASAEFLSASPSPKECYEDLLWALVNSKQFLFVR